MCYEEGTDQQVASYLPANLLWVDMLGRSAIHDDQVVQSRGRVAERILGGL